MFRVKLRLPIQTVNAKGTVDWIVMVAGSPGSALAALTMRAILPPL